MLLDSFRWQTVQHWNVHFLSVANSTTQINLFWMTVRFGKNTKKHTCKMINRILMVGRKLTHIWKHLIIASLGAKQSIQLEDVNSVQKKESVRSRLRHQLYLSMLNMIPIIGRHMLLLIHLRRTWITFPSTLLAQMALQRFKVLLLILGLVMIKLLNLSNNQLKLSKLLPKRSKLKKM